MAKLTIDGKEYDTDALSDKAKATKSKDKAAPASSEDPVLDDEIDAVMAA